MKLQTTSTVCVRYVDHDVIVHEEFVGMYEVSVTTGESLAKVMMMILQTWQGYIREHRPLSRSINLPPYVHCVSLIKQHACTASSVGSTKHSRVKNLSESDQLYLR